MPSISDIGVSVGVIAGSMVFSLIGGRRVNSEEGALSPIEINVVRRGVPSSLLPVELRLVLHISVARPSIRLSLEVSRVRSPVRDRLWVGVWPVGLTNRSLIIIECLFTVFEASMGLRRERGHPRHCCLLWLRFIKELSIGFLEVRVLVNPGYALRLCEPSFSELLFVGLRMIDHVLRPSLHHHLSFGGGQGRLCVVELLHSGVELHRLAVSVRLLCLSIMEALEVSFEVFIFGELLVE